MMRITLQVVPGDVSALAAVADKIMEHHPPETSVEIMAIKVPEQDLAKQLVEITKQLNELRTRLDSTAQPRQRARSRYRSNSRVSTSREFSRTPQRSTICFYHRRFKDKARKCYEPCSWSPNKDTQPTENENSRH